jgi:hypothetical protein
MTWDHFLTLCVAYWWVIVFFILPAIGGGIEQGVAWHHRSVKSRRAYKLKMARLRAGLPDKPARRGIEGCLHENVDSVRDQVTGNVLRWLCLDCDAPLKLIDNKVFRRDDD